MLYTATATTGRRSCRTLDAVEDDDRNLAAGVLDDDSRDLRVESCDAVSELASLHEFALPRLSPRVLRARLGTRTGRRRGRRPSLREGATRAPPGLGRGRSLRRRQG